MHARYMPRLAVLTLLGAGLLGLTGCGNDSFVSTTQLSGTNEVPAVTTTSASGTATATLDGDELSVTGTFRDLSSNLEPVRGSGAHIHSAPAGQNGDIVFNLEVTSSDQRTGSFTGKAKLTKEQQESFKNGNLYVNIHTVNFMGGEIRGQFASVK
ncbi:CHRD domain-containing protein [Archangium sp.]|uniref:CHRD domain-containing protein n=1 Tax=Archangium sp. TaxID=1872627 RepID=UPI002D315F25|nr:CHRD domain-containing protein [Archangium sp.]HYO59824.1 CHRD domain-containing protein [Archangium sp.]